MAILPVLPGLKSKQSTTQKKNYTAMKLIRISLFYKCLFGYYSNIDGDSAQPFEKNLM